MSTADADKLLRDGAPIGFRSMTIQERIKEALQRIRDGRAYMRIPADQTDPDIVLADCLSLLERETTPPEEVRKDDAQLVWLEEMFKACPHAEIIYNDDQVDENPVGFTIMVQGCTRMEVTAPTLADAIALAMKTEPDEDGNVVASVPSPLARNSYRGMGPVTIGESPEHRRNVSMMEQIRAIEALKTSPDLLAALQKIIEHG